MSRPMCAAAALGLVLCASTPSRAQLVINEIDYDQDSADNAEFIELRNNGAAVSINGFELELINGANGLVYRTIVLPDVTVAQNDSFVICANSATVPNCDLDVTPDTDLIQNGPPDAIALRDGTGGTILDSLSYEGDVAGFTEGTADTVEDLPTVAIQSIGRSPDGTDTGDNSADFVFACATPGAPNQSGLCCGNGLPDPGEACDDGGVNGTTDCGCQTNCQLSGIGTTCGDPTDDDCTNPDTCDGAGTCLDNHEVATTACGDPTDDDCTNPDTCDGNGSCLDNHEVATTACGDPTDDDCTNPDTCDGNGVCLDNHELIDTACGSGVDDECSDSDSCDGNGSCLANDQADGTLCDDGDGNDCTGLCASGACGTGNRPGGSACGNPSTGDCDLADSCDGSGSCLVNLVADGTSCTDDGTFCNGIEICASGNCVSDGDPCEAMESCDESADVCVRPECGNGEIDDGEECDDFNFDSGDGCDNCAIESGWVCGDDDGDGTSDCNETCGNGSADDFESCDDGNTEQGDGCDDHCQVEAGFDCSSSDDVDVCVTTCGDGITVGAEACDDGNTSDGDGCDRCEVEDGFVCDRQSPSLCAEEDLAGFGCGCHSGGGGNPATILLLIAALLGLAPRRRGC